jgi:hypothetical protein
MSLILKSITKTGECQFSAELLIGNTVIGAVFTIDRISDSIRTLNVNDECVGKLLTFVGGAGVLNKRIFLFEVEGVFAPISLSDIDNDVLLNAWLNLRSGATLDELRRSARF